MRNSKTTYVFIDGGYLRQRCIDMNRSIVDPQKLALELSRMEYGHKLARVTYYDAIPDDQASISSKLQAYWDAVERKPDTHLGFGSLRGGTKRKPPRQKGVDTLIAVDMLVGAFTSIYSEAILVAGDSDFVPVVNEVQRQGVRVIVTGVKRSVADDLQRIADRFYEIDDKLRAAEAIKLDGAEWDGTL